MIPDVLRADEQALPAAVPHPEEMKAGIRLKVGGFLTMEGHARATPAGMLAVAVLVGVAVASSVLAARSRFPSAGRRTDIEDRHGGG
jgi:hypothetical protein